jgi:hypothetical protein
VNSIVVKYSVWWTEVTLAFGSGLSVDGCRIINGSALCEWTYSPVKDGELKSVILTLVIVTAGIGSSEGASTYSHYHSLSSFECIVLLALRVWGVWDNSRNLGVALVLFYILCWGGAFIVMGIAAANQHGERFLTL